MGLICIAARAELKFAALAIGDTVYKDAVILDVSATDVLFKHSTGISNIKLRYLSTELQKRFHYDPLRSERTERQQDADTLLYQQTASQRAWERALARKAAAEAESEANVTFRLADPVGENSLLSKNPDQYKKLADPYDDKAPLEARVRSYLQSNCANCHVDAGGGNAQFNAEHTASLSDTKLIDIDPVHHKFDLPSAKLVAPGHPERSILLYRLSHRGRGQMPQLATNLVDEKMVKVVEDWIKGLPVLSDKR